MSNRMAEIDAAVPMVGVLSDVLDKFGLYVAKTKNVDLNIGTIPVLTLAMAIRRLAHDFPELLEKTDLDPPLKA